MKIIPALAALATAGALLALQIVAAVEATEGASTYTRASMITAMVTVAVLPVFIHLAWRNKFRALSLALCVAFVSLLAYSLPAIVGRTGEIKHRQATISDMSATVRSDLSATMQRLDWARGDWMAECRTGAGAQCKGKAQTVAALEARVEKLRSELKAAPAGDLGSEAWAWASMGTVSAETIRKASVLAFALGLDMAIWALVALATGLVSRPIPTDSKPNSVARYPNSVSRNGFQASDLTIPSGTTDAELEELRKLLQARGPVTNNELADLMGCVKSEASKRVSKAVAAGLVTRRRIGREVAITLH